MTARNIEIKCRCDDLRLVEGRAEHLGARAAGVFQQRDTFFSAPNARLKLRDFGDGRAELIAYERPDAVEARASHYSIVSVQEPAQLVAVLSQALGVSGVLKKRRRLFLYRHTRIHLDEVEGLGTFVELETVVSEQSDQDAYLELQQVADALGLKNEDRVPLPYVELLAAASSQVRFQPHR